MEKKEMWTRTTDGFELYTVLYLPEAPKAHVHILHGMAEHIGRYEEFASFLTEQGFAVSGHDHRGHGRTTERNGIKGHFADENGFELVVQDARRVIRTVQANLSGIPFILFGHSLGSFIARRYIQHYSDTVNQVVLSGSGGNPKLPGKAGLAFALSSAKLKGKDARNPLLLKLTFGRFNRAFPNSKSDFAWLTRDEEMVRSYIEDPLSGFIPTNQFFADLFTGIFTIHEEREVKKIRKKLPVLYISGLQDPVGENGKGIFMAARQFAAAGMTDVAVYLVEEGRHELLNELKKEQHYDTIVKWMKRYG